MFPSLFRRTLIALTACVAMVAVCYVFVDRQVAWFVYENHLSRFTLVKWDTLPPPIVQTWVPAVLTILFVRRAWRPWKRWELAIVAAGVAMIVADQFRLSLAVVCGRDWPETWIHHNPSLIGNDAYGFHPLADVGDHGSFPSGHMARTLAVVAVCWIVWPRWHGLGVVLSVALAVALVLMNYHFVGDCIAGGFLGAIVGSWTAYGCGLSGPIDHARGHDLQESTTQREGRAVV